METEPPKNQMHIVALGSSFAAGPGIPPISSVQARRSGNNYANILSKKLNARLTDLTSSGATLQNILNEPQTLSTGTQLPPQLSQFPADVDIVTITAGGNDAQYSAKTMLAAADGSWLAWALRAFLPTLDSNPAGADVIAERFVAIIDEIRRMAPNCKKVFLVEYLSVFGPDTRPTSAGVPLRIDQIRELEALAKVVQEGYRLAAAARSDIVELVPIADLSESRALGSEEPWVDGLSWSGLLAGRAPFHPNLKGMQSVADVLYDRLK